MKTWKIAVPVVALAILTAASAFAASSTPKASHSSSSSSSLSSSTSGNWTFGIKGGASMPTGDFGDVGSTGWNFGAQADYWMNSTWGFGFDGSYNAGSGASAMNDQLVANPLYGPGTEFKWSSMQYGVHAIYLIPTQGGQVSPYLQGGLSGYNMGSKIDGGLNPSDSSENKFGYNMGAGVDFHASPTVNVGVNGTYHYVTTDPATNWFGIQGRVTFKIPTSTK